MPLPGWVDLATPDIAKADQHKRMSQPKEKEVLTLGLEYPVLADLVGRLESATDAAGLARLADGPALPLLRVRLGDPGLVPVALLARCAEHTDGAALELGLADLGHANALLAAPLVEHARLERRGQFLARLGLDELFVDRKSVV